MRDNIFSYVSLTLLCVYCWLALSLRATGRNDVERERAHIETHWVAEVIGSGGQAVQSLGRFDSLEKAEEACQAWSKAHPDDLRLTRTREIKQRVRVTPPLARKPQPANTSLSGPKGPPIEADNQPVLSGTATQASFLGTWKDAKLGLTMKFNADGSFTSIGKGRSLKGTWTLAGNSFSAKLPDEKGYVAHMLGQLRDDTVTYHYYATGPDGRRSGVSSQLTLEKQLQ